MSDKVQTQLWLRPTTKALLQRAAKREGKTMNVLADEILTRHLTSQVADLDDRIARMTIARQAT